MFVCFEGLTENKALLSSLTNTTICRQRDQAREMVYADEYRSLLAGVYVITRRSALDPSSPLCLKHVKPSPLLSV